ncbi:MAG: hypothetical protein CL868_09610 [Cytophagaceae bacterium]|nr:hypothetical protein [Cytophagaceae bacterium]|tara:strand:- start:5408 stop:5743 length:336 start_codon:yes stop_codon:yes gene_type:complete
MEEGYLVVNYFDIEDNKVLVGATDDDRWNYELEDGASGGDARTFIMVELIVDPRGRAATLENVKIFSSPGDMVRPLAFKYVSRLADTAWEILNKKLDYDKAREIYFGMIIK